MSVSFPVWQELGIIVVIGIPFRGTNLASTLGYSLSTAVGTTNDVNVHRLPNASHTNTDDTFNRLWKHKIQTHLNTEIESNSGRFHTPPTFKHISYDMIVKTSGEIQNVLHSWQHYIYIYKPQEEPHCQKIKNIKEDYNRSKEQNSLQNKRYELQTSSWTKSVSFWRNHLPLAMDES